MPPELLKHLIRLPDTNRLEYASHISHICIAYIYMYHIQYLTHIHGNRIHNDILYVSAGSRTDPKQIQELLQEGLELSH